MNETLSKSLLWILFSLAEFGDDLEQSEPAAVLPLLSSCFPFSVDVCIETAGLMPVLYPKTLLNLLWLTRGSLMKCGSHSWIREQTPPEQWVFYLVYLSSLSSLLRWCLDSLREWILFQGSREESLNVPWQWHKHPGPWVSPAGMGCRQQGYSHNHPGCTRNSSAQLTFCALLSKRSLLSAGFTVQSEARAAQGTASICRTSRESEKLSLS